ncbi:hypothetical protein GCM10009430_37550 [Aquimarina litoralis]|uniref:Uncharacterized protein n=1 Tax=Aquimarina litoralis TaxID=584605 RepID=A0ABP3UAE7_9FLAO
MELYDLIIKIIDVNLIQCLIPIILTLFLVKVFFKNRFETKKALNLIRWLIIIYTFITWTISLVTIIINPEEATFINRAVGPYAIIYWIMFIAALILPFTLMIKKMAIKFWYVMFIAFCMKVGIYFERFIIITTSYHRDYLTENGNIEFIYPFLLGISILFVQGVIIAILILGIFQILKRKTIHNTG